MDGTRVLACERCPALVASRRAILNGRFGDGGKEARILFIGERPGQYDDQRKRAFSGEDGDLLRRMIDEAGISRQDVFYTYAVRCWPLGNRKPTAAEVRACAEHLAGDVEAVQPKVIVALGGGAFDALFKGEKFSEAIGQVREWNGIPVITTFAPGFVFRNKWGLVPLIEAHLTKAARIAAGQLPVVPLEEVRKNWHALTTPEQVAALEDYLLSDEVAVITVDSETTGLNWMEDELLCVSFSALDREMRAIEQGFTIPLLHATNISEDTDTPSLQSVWEESDTLDEVANAVGRILRSRKPKAIQNASFDIRMFERSHTDEAVTAATAFGWETRNLRYDPMLLQRLLDENMPANETVMTALYTEVPYYEAEVKELTHGKTRMWLAPDEVLWTYAAGDADVLARLVEVLARMARHEGVLWLHDNISIPMVRTTWAMTRRGIDVDLPYFTRLCNRYRDLVAEAEGDVMRAYGRGTFNLNAPAQVRRVLFQELGLPESGRKTKGAASCEACQKQEECEEHDSTSKDALLDTKALMVEAGQEPHPIIDAVLKWKELSKRKQTYLDGSNGDKGMLRFIARDRKVHPEFKVNRADTGRLAATNPPIQTIPKNVVDEVLNSRNALRRMFVAPSGYTLMELDWNQGEVWVMAYESGDELLLELLTSGQDVHTYVARKLCSFGISRVFPASALDAELTDGEWKAAHDSLRGKAKVFVFGLDYGMTEVGAGERLGCSAEEAALLIDAFLGQVFPSLQEHFERVRKQIEEYGFVKNRFGRIGHFPDYDLLRSFGRRGNKDWEASFRKAVNMPIQAGLSDLHQLVHINLESDRAIRERIAFNNAVHDSVAGIVKGEPHELEKMVEVAWLIKDRAETMAKDLILPDGTRLGWEIPVEVQWGKSWGEFEYALTPQGEVKEPKSE